MSSYSQRQRLSVLSQNLAEASTSLFTNALLPFATSITLATMGPPSHQPAAVVLPSDMTTWDPAFDRTSIANTMLITVLQTHPLPEEFLQMHNKHRPVHASPPDGLEIRLKRHLMLTWERIVECTGGILEPPARRIRHQRWRTVKTSAATMSFVWGLTMKWTSAGDGETEISHLKDWPQEVLMSLSLQIPKICPPERPIELSVPPLLENLLCRPRAEKCILCAVSEVTMMKNGTSQGYICLLLEQKLIWMIQIYPEISTKLGKYYGISY